LADALVRPVPGDHYSMLREPHVRALAAELRALLAAAEAPDRRARGARG
jgi:thioesterase domain-containing protein